jgi:hypothetical protein
MLREGRGRWTMLQFDTLSTATFVRGALTSLSPIGQAREYLSIHSVALGIAMQDSVQSLPAGKVQIKVPNDADTSFWITMPVGIAASALSAGQPMGSTKSGNDHVFTANPSLTSRLGITTGRYLLSPVSEAEAIPNATNWAFGQVSIVTALS